MTTNTLSPDTCTLTLTERALAVLGPDLVAEFVDMGGELEELTTHPDAVQLAAGYLRATMIAEAATCSTPKARHRITLGYYRATAAELFARRAGDHNHTISAVCRDCDRTTWLDETAGIPVGMYSMLRGAVPSDMDYEDRCGWCGAEVTA